MGEKDGEVRGKVLGRKREAEEEEAEVDEREGLRETERECLLGCEWPLLLLAERPRERERETPALHRGRERVVSASLLEGRA